MISTWGNHSTYGDYEIVGAADGAPRLLGEGSFGKTFEGVRTNSIAGREIRSYAAVKVLNPDVLTNEAKRLQLFAEVESLNKLRHPNLVHYTDCGEQDGEVFYTMELCRGGDLTQLVRRFGPLPERAAAWIALQVTAGLRELHRRRMVHRDIKPSNIMLVEELEPGLALDDLAPRFEAHETLIRVVDFGLVNLAVQNDEAPHRFVGSANFASPEQIREQPIDGRSDIYSLGMTLWYLVQGGGPFLTREGVPVSDIREVFRRHLAPEEFDRLFPLRLSTPFRRLLARMLAKHCDSRFSNAAELQHAIRAYLDSSIELTPEFTVTRLHGNLDSAYELGKRLSNNGAASSYAAVERNTRRAVRLSVFSKVQGDTRDESVAHSLCELARLTHDSNKPEVLLPVDSVIWASDFFASTEELHPLVSLAEILKARAGAKRPLSFSEAMLVLQPIARGLDFLLEHRVEAVSLRSEEVWIGRAGHPVPSQDEMATKPLTEWGALEVRISPMCLPSDEEAISTVHADKSTGSLQLTADELHPLPSFARLVYRIINGAELAAVVRFTPEAYTPAVGLSAASNALIRDLISGQKRPANVSAVLKDLAANEAVLRAPVLTRPPTASIEVPPHPPSDEHPTRFDESSIPSDRIIPLPTPKRSLAYLPLVGAAAACAALTFLAWNKDRLFNSDPAPRAQFTQVTSTPAAPHPSTPEVKTAPLVAAASTPAAATPAPATPAKQIAAATPAATPAPAPPSSSRQIAAATPVAIRPALASGDTATRPAAGSSIVNTPNSADANIPIVPPNNPSAQAQLAHPNIVTRPNPGSPAGHGRY